MCTVQHERIFTQAAAQFGEEEWMALLDFAFPHSHRLRAFHIWRLSQLCGGGTPTDLEAGNHHSVTSSSLGLSSSCSLPATSPLSPLTHSFRASQAPCYNDLLSNTVSALECCSPQMVLTIFQEYLPEQLANLRNLLPALRDELQEEEGKKEAPEEGDWVVVDDQTFCSGNIAQEQSPCQAMYLMASTVMRLIHEAVATPAAAPPALHAHAPADFQRLRRKYLHCADSLLLPLHSLCTSSRGGSLIFRTSDRRFILKQITEAECTQLVGMAEAYVAHVLAHPSTLLCLIFGCFGYLHGGRCHYFVLAENSYPPDTPVDVVYDLKGSSASRSVLGQPRRCFNRLHRRSQQMCVDPLLALKDNDLQCPLELPSEGARQELEARLHADSHFLMQCGVFDYSLLVAVSCGAVAPAAEVPATPVAPQRQWLSNGSALSLKIVDFLTPWRVSLQVAGLPLLQLPTIRSLGYLVTRRIIPEASTLPPALYQERFVRRVLEKFSVPCSP